MHPRPQAYRCPLGCMLAKLQVGLGSSKHHPAESGCPTVKETIWNDTWMEQICGWFQMEQRRSLWLFAWIYHWYISWWIGHFQTNSYFNHVRIHAHWDFPGRRTCYQDLPSSGHRTNTISATYRNHKKKHMSDAKSTKSDSTASCLSAAPAMLSHGWKHWIRLDPRWRFEGIG